MIRIGAIKELQDKIDSLIEGAQAKSMTKKSQSNSKKIRHFDNTDIIDAHMGHGEVVEVLFSHDKSIHKKKATQGWLHDTMYFGLMLPVKQPITDKEGIIIGNEIVPKLVWVFDDKRHALITKIYQKLNNIKVQDEPTEDNLRWSLVEIQKWVHSTASQPYPTITAQDLFQRIRNQFKKYLWFDDDIYYDILPLWIIGTYCYQLFQSYPYINLWGIKNSGKSKVMQLSSILAFNSQVFINMTVASLFRIIELDSPTLFIDEAENLWDQNQKKDDDTSEIVACLNGGWQKGSKVPRVEKIDGKQKLVKFDVYCPKMLASIKGLKGALDTRCIRIIMVRPTGQSASQLWMNEDDPELLSIRDQIYSFVLSNWKVISAYYSEGELGVKNSFGLDNRDWQIWKPILGLAKLVSDDLVKNIGEWAMEECEMNKEEEVNEEAWETKIFKALLSLVQSESLVKVYMKDIKTAVDKEFVERSYFDNFQDKEVEVYSKNRPSSNFIGRLMNKIGFKKDKFRDNDRGYWLNKKRVAHVIFSVSRMSDGNVGIVEASYSKHAETIVSVIEALKGSLSISPSFDEISKALPDYKAEELLKLLGYMKDQKLIFESKPDCFEVLK